MATHEKVSTLCPRVCQTKHESFPTDSLHTVSIQWILALTIFLLPSGIFALFRGAVALDFGPAF
jgi:hypothetical protein